MQERALICSGDFVSIPLKTRQFEGFLDGFWRHDAVLQKTLLVFVHGMHSNFYRSRLKKMLMRSCVEAGCDLLSFNNRGAEQNVAYEHFEDCLADIRAVLDFGRARGYRRFVLAGHSTGCQKIVYYQARCLTRGVEGLVLLAPGDDYAIARREAGRRFALYVAKARNMVEEGRGDKIMPARCCLGFSARRYLDIADPARTEAKVFNYEGRLHHFRQVKIPVLLLFGSEEEYACLPVPVMHEILRGKSRSRRFDEIIIPGADHGFHGCEAETAAAVLDWVQYL